MLTGITKNLMKLLIFDSWTLGSVHIYRILEKLHDRNIECVFAHIGSWGDDPFQEIEEMRDGLKFRDIRFYGSLPKILEIEQPDAVLFLSLDPLIHRAFNRFVKKANITSFNLYPGLWSAQNYSNHDIPKVGRRNYLAELIKRSHRALRYSIPQYLHACLKTSGGVNETLNLFREIKLKIDGKTPSKAFHDAETDMIFVFNKYDQLHALRKFGVPKSKVHIVGVPDFLKFGFTNDMIGMFGKTDTGKRSKILYIGTGNRGSKYLLSNDKKYIEFLLKISRALKKQNIKLAVKLHYSRSAVIEELEKEHQHELIVCKSEEFLKTLTESMAAIAEPSTATLLPIGLGLPILFPQFEEFQSLAFSDSFKEYKRSKTLTRLEDLDDIRRFPKQTSVTADELIEICGPLPISEFSDRVTTKLYEKMNENKDEN